MHRHGHLAYFSVHPAIGRDFAEHQHSRASIRRWELLMVTAAAFAAALLPRHPAGPATLQSSQVASAPAAASMASAVGSPVFPGRGQQLAAAKARRAGSPARKPAARKPAVAKRRTAAAALKGSRKPLVVLAARAATREGAGRPLRVGDELPARATVRTGKGGRLTLVTRRGSEFTLNADSELSLAARDTASLRRGEIYCRSRGGEIKLVNTAAGKISLLGTVIDAAAQDNHRVAVTVVTGKVRLSNAHGEAVVPAGQRSLMVASAAPTAGAAANVLSETAWYDGRGTVVSDFGDIAYAISRREGLMTEIWAMKADGSNKHRVRSFLGFSEERRRWLPAQQWIMVKSVSACWADANLETRRGEADYYTLERSVVSNAEWLVHAATGQDAAFEQLADYDVRAREISPDGTRLAFTGVYQPDADRPETKELGVWVYDLRTGQMSKVLDGYVDSITWSPDSRWVIAAKGSASFPNHPLILIDTRTARTTDLRIQGAGECVSFSPDGAKLAYCDDFTSTEVTSGSVYVLDLKSGGEPRPIAREGGYPRWSPDGARIAYWIKDTEWVNADTGERWRGAYIPGVRVIQTFTGYRVFVTRSDGSGTTEIYHTEPGSSTLLLRAVSWAPAGDALYFVTDDTALLVAADGSGRVSNTTLLVAADGSGRVSNLGGNDKDSILPPAQGAETEAALKAVQEAIFQYAVGNLRSFEGKPNEARAAFQASADIFAALPYEYPLANFSVNDVLRYADKAQLMAERPAAAVLAESCGIRMRRLAYLLAGFTAHEKRFPATLSEVETRALTNARDRESVRMLFRCPDGGPFAYTPPPAGGEPGFGALMVACPQHADCRVVWDDRAADDLGWRRCDLAREQRDRDPQLKAAYDKTVKMRRSADIGRIPWNEVEAAYAALINRLPDDMRLREELGRMYTRRGAYEEALQVLPPASSGPWPWTPLTRAFCLDALGKRAEALAIYQRLQRSLYPLLPRYRCGPTTSVGAWARLGLKQPTWPRDLDSSPRPGEVRVAPTPEWYASSSPAKTPPRPELAIDGNPAAPWFGYTSDGRKGQLAGTWFQLDFGAPQPISRILFDHQGTGTFHVSDWPRSLEAWGTSEGTTWHKVPITQAGPLQGAEIRFDSPQLVRAVRLVLTADHEPGGDWSEYWRICEVYVFGPARQR